MQYQNAKEIASSQSGTPVKVLFSLTDPFPRIHATLTIASDIKTRLLRCGVVLPGDSVDFFAFLRDNKSFVALGDANIYSLLSVLRTNLDQGSYFNYRYEEIIYDIDQVTVVNTLQLNDLSQILQAPHAPTGVPSKLTMTLK